MGGADARPRAPGKVGPAVTEPFPNVTFRPSAAYLVLRMKSVLGLLVAVGAMVVLAGCNSSHHAKHTILSEPPLIHVRIPPGSHKHFAAGVLHSGATIRCGKGVGAAKVPPPGHGITTGSLSLHDGSGGIFVQTRKDGSVEVRCGLPRHASKIDVHVTINHGHSGLVRYTFSCPPARGDFPNLATACKEIASDNAMLHPPKMTATCAGSEGVPPEVSVKGSANGEQVDFSVRSCDLPASRARAALAWLALFPGQATRRSDRHTLKGPSRRYSSARYSFRDVKRAFTDHGFKLSVLTHVPRARAQWDIGADWRGRGRAAVPGVAGDVTITIWRRIPFAATQTEEWRAAHGGATALRRKNVSVRVSPHISSQHRHMVEAALAELRKNGST